MAEFDAVLATEDSIWAPDWGLKGQVDATLVRHALPHTLTHSLSRTTAAARGASGGSGGGRGGGGSEQLVMMPLELKTMASIAKKHYKEAEHRAQMMLYTLMLQSRYVCVRWRHGQGGSVA